MSRRASYTPALTKEYTLVSRRLVDHCASLRVTFSGCKTIRSSSIGAWGISQASSRNCAGKVKRTRTLTTLTTILCARFDAARYDACPGLGGSNEAARFHHAYRHYGGGVAHSNTRATEERSISYRATDRLSCTLAQ